MFVWEYMCYVCVGVHELWVCVTSRVLCVRECMSDVCEGVHELWVCGSA